MTWKKLCASKIGIDNNYITFIKVGVIKDGFGVNDNKIYYKFKNKTDKTVSEGYIDIFNENSISFVKVYFNAEFKSYTFAIYKRLY